MKKNINDLKKVVQQTITDLSNDSEFKAMYPNIIAYSSNKIYLQKIIAKTCDIVINQGVENIYEALGQIENSLFTETE